MIRESFRVSPERQLHGGVSQVKLIKDEQTSVQRHTNPFLRQMLTDINVGVIIECSIKKRIHTQVTSDYNASEYKPTSKRVC